MPRDSRQRLHCLLISGRVLSDNACEDLLLSCCAMARASKNTFDLKTDEVEGRIETDFVEGGMGGIWGCMFSAELETNEGTTKIRFIIRFNDLKNISDLNLERIGGIPWAPWLAPESQTDGTIH